MVVFDIAKLFDIILAWYANVHCRRRRWVLRSSTYPRPLSWRRNSCDNIDHYLTHLLLLQMLQETWVFFIYCNDVNDSWITQPKPLHVLQYLHQSITELKDWKQCNLQARLQDINIITLTKYIQQHSSLCETWILSEDCVAFERKIVCIVHWGSKPASVETR